MTIAGIDYAFSPHPPIAALKAARVAFACRYISPDPANDTNGKNLLPAECKALLGAGIHVVVVAESYAARMKAGHAAGTADAQHASAVVNALSMHSIPVYFACDFDATPGDQAAIDAYLDGAASVIGRGRTGIYGGFYPVKRALDAGKATYAWQTIAWSGGQWDLRANLRQGLQVTIGGVSVDVDNAQRPDYGQWPRPAPAPAPAGFTQYTADGKTSLAGFCASRGIAVDDAIALMVTHHPNHQFGSLQAPYIVAGDWTALMPAGMTCWA
jgi:Rv2525c-like, glycoside hydrolase-like domain